MRISQNGFNFIKGNEGLVLVISNDVGHPVIGYGHDLLPSRPTRGAWIETPTAVRLGP